MKLSDTQLNELELHIATWTLSKPKTLILSIIQELKLAREVLKFLSPPCNEYYCTKPKCAAQRAYDDFGKEANHEHNR